MSVPPHAQIKLGTSVSIVLKQDQRTGKQVQGQVAQVLTKGNHPRGVKVRLTDNRIGRVQRLVASSSPLEPSSTPQKKYYRKMDHNPWADSSATHNNIQQPSQGHSQQRYYSDQQQQQQQQYQPPQQPYTQPSQQSFGQPQQSHGGANDFYNQSGFGQTQQQPDYNAWSGESGNPPPARPYQGQQQSQPNQQIRRQDTDTLLEAQPDRAEQVEHLQAYEATAQQSQGDRHRAQLEKEFPDVDGSLIAALYSDTQDLSSTREMLQELNRS